MHTLGFQESHILTPRLRKIITLSNATIAAYRLVSILLDHVVLAPLNFCLLHCTFHGRSWGGMKQDSVISPHSLHLCDIWYMDQGLYIYGLRRTWMLTGVNWRHVEILLLCSTWQLQSGFPSSIWAV